MDKKEIIRQYMSELGKSSQKKNPKTREQMSEMGKKSAEVRRLKRLEDN